MSLKSITDRVLKSAEFRIDRATIEWRNDFLDARFYRNEEYYLKRIHEAVGLGCDWFAPQKDVSMSVLWVGSKSDLLQIDDRFDFVHQKHEHYRRTIRDPALRLLDFGYDPNAEPYRDLAEVMQVRPYLPVELLMIDCVWADVRPQEDILDRLRAFDDDGFYGTTHIVVGGLILLENGGAPPDAVRELIQQTIEPMWAANDRTSVAGDIFAERIMCLQWLGRHDLIRPAWILRLLRAQRTDGGWGARNMPPIGQSNQHTTILAMAALAGFRTAHLRGSGTSAEQARPTTAFPREVT
jgi:hypothetical protein